jgi:hypothetical protein
MNKITQGIAPLLCYEGNRFMLETVQNIENIRRVTSGTYKLQQNNDVSEDQSHNLPPV